jgi:outer membrane protein TolC
MAGPRKVLAERRVARLIGLLALAALIAIAPLAPGTDKTPELPAPRSTGKDTSPQGPDILPLSASRPLDPAIPVSLSDVLRLAIVANLDIAQANLVIERARANVLFAKSTYLPNLSLGSTYTRHEGTIQRTEGTVVPVNRDSLFVGGLSTFALNISDALFALPEARRRLEAAYSGQVRVTNETLLQVVTAYVNVLRARRILARLDETLDFLASETESELRGGSRGLLPLIKAFVKAGTALPSDQTRVEADVVRRLAERARAAQDVRTASAELARLLHINPALFLLPVEDYRWPLEMAGGPWFEQSIDTLVMQALQSRPELAENAALLRAAFLRYQAARYRPLVPNLVFNYQYGGFGGGPRVVGRTATGGQLLGNSGVIGDFGSRTDMDVGLVWRLQGFGVGNAAQTLDARARLESHQVQQLFLQDQVVAQVVSALEQIQRGAERVDICRASLFDEKRQPTGAVYRSLRLNFLRIKGGQGLPLEVLDSTRRLSDVLDQYAVALSDYDLGRFRLLVALGLPPQALVEPHLMPLPPGCVPPMKNPSTGGFVGKEPVSGTTSSVEPSKERSVLSGENRTTGVHTSATPIQPTNGLPRRALPDDGLHALPSPRR